MNRQKQYLADNVDAMGNVFPTVGENIRHGVKGITFPDIVGVSNARLLTIKIGSNGDVELSEDIDFTTEINEDSRFLNIHFTSNIACSYPILINNINAYEIWSSYTVSTADYGKINIRQCPFNSVCVLLIADKV